jgi:hypothetical protein
VRVAGIAYDLGVSFAVDQLELVLEPRDLEARQAQHPGAVLAVKVARGEVQVRTQTHGRVAPLGIIEAKGPHHRAEGSVKSAERA